MIIYWPAVVKTIVSVQIAVKKKTNKNQNANITVKHKRSKIYSRPLHPQHPLCHNLSKVICQK